MTQNQRKSRGKDFLWGGKRIKKHQQLKVNNYSSGTAIHINENKNHESGENFNVFQKRVRSSHRIKQA
jgi:hypothetical protein